MHHFQKEPRQSCVTLSAQDHYVQSTVYMDNDLQQDDFIYVKLFANHSVCTTLHIDENDAIQPCT